MLNFILDKICLFFKTLIYFYSIVMLKNSTMKSLSNPLKAFFLLLSLSFVFSACDPCANMICDNGTCSEGSCLCDEGYFKNGSNCIAVNIKYVGIGTATASQMVEDNLGNISNLPDVEITLIASTTDTYSFTLLRFNGQIKNDIVFSVSTTDDNVLSTLNNPLTTSAGNTYNVSGNKVGTQVTLTISEPGGDTYTLNYAA